MSFKFGRTLQINLFGQSHSPCIGVTIEGLPVGIKPDEELIHSLLRRRQGGQLNTTPRKEPDVPHIISGLNEQELTCGAPLAAIFYNTNTRPEDYKRIDDILRPGHSDLVAYDVFGDAHDIRGGGMFSARLTAPLVFAGALAMQILSRYNIHIAAHILTAAGVSDEVFDAIQLDTENLSHLKDQIAALAANGLCVSKEKQDQMTQSISNLAAKGDSCGGIIECIATDVIRGLGDPRFDGIDALLARNLFALPAVKGVEFGLGFRVASAQGSTSNDAYVMQNDSIALATNNCGGVLSGITTGSPLLFRVAFKPTPSISTPQQSVNRKTQTDEMVTVMGRHDPCVCIRALPVVEAICALTLADLLLTKHL